MPEFRVWGLGFRVRGFSDHLGVLFRGYGAGFIV